MLYRGRGLEWFSAEVTDIFEWMSLKRRHNPMKIGTKDIVVNNERGEIRESRADIRILREEDNHFYWISVEGLTAKKTYSTLVARVLDGNRINIETYYIKHVRCWFGRGMIDFSKPVTVQRGSTVKTVTATPNLAVLLEDFLERGDRQRLFFADRHLRRRYRRSRWRGFSERESSRGLGDPGWCAASRETRPARAIHTQQRLIQVEQ